MARFRTLRQRLADPPDPDETLPETVLPYMAQPLWNWFSTHSVDLYGGWDTELCETLAQILRIAYGADVVNALSKACNNDPSLLLDLLDARLANGRFRAGRSMNTLNASEELAATLERLGSAYTVNGSRTGLELRVDPTVRSAVEQATQARGSAGPHMAEAWKQAYGRSGSPSYAHAEMIKAVESAAIPILAPKDKLATLGKLLAQLRNDSASWTTAGASAKNDGIEAIASMMAMLWEQQTDRHGAPMTIPATTDRVRSLIPVAAALTHLFASGSVRRR